MAVEIPAMNNSQAKELHLREGIGKSTLLSTTHVKIPMPSGAKEPAASTSNTNSGNKSGEGKNDR
jgi:hypothetical protein